MRRARFYLRLMRLAAVLGFGLLLATGLRLQALLGFNPPQRTRQRACHWFMRSLAAVLPFDIHVSGALPDQPMLWVANHQSWSDIPLLGMLQPMTFLAKADIRQWPVVGWLTAEAGTAFIQRGSGEHSAVSQRLAANLSQGRSQLIFPEGTTTDGTSLRMFHSRLLAAAISAGVPIQPVALRYLRNGVIDPVAPFIGDDDLLAHPFRLMAEDTAVVEITLLPPIKSEGMQRNQLARQCHGAIAQALYGDIQPLPLAA